MKWSHDAFLDGTSSHMHRCSAALRAANECGSLLERDGYSPSVAALDNEDLSAKHLLEYLFEGPHIAQRPKGLRLEKERPFVLAGDPCRNERPVVSRQPERAGYCRLLTDVEHALHPMEPVAENALNPT